MKISLPTWTWALTLTSERIQQYLQVPKSSNGIGTSLIIHPCTTFLVYRSEERSHENKKQCISIDSSHIPSLSFLHMYVHPFSVSPTDLYSTHAISYQLFHAALLRTMPSPSLTLHFAFYAFHDQRQTCIRYHPVPGHAAAIDLPRNHYPTQTYSAPSLI